MTMKIRAFQDATGYAPASEAWHAIDTDSYDADCDENGFFSTSLVGTGATAEAAIADLMEQIGDDCPICERCGHAMTKNAWPATTWFCERCDDCQCADPDILREDRDERRRLAAEDGP